MAAKKARKKLEANKKDYGKATQDLWITIQWMPDKDFSVHISSYHYGNMEGPECKRLL